MQEVFENEETLDETIRLYVRKMLTAEEEIEFEQWYLDKPEMVEKIILEEAFLRGVQKAQAVEIHSNHKGMKNWRKVGLAMAATVFLSLVSIAYFWDQTAVSVSPSIVYLETFRSDSDEFEMVYQYHEMEKVVVIDLPPNIVGTVTLQIISEDSKQIVNRSISPNKAGEVIFILMREEVSEGKYQVKISQREELLQEYVVSIKQH